MCTLFSNLADAILSLCSLLRRKQIKTHAQTLQTFNKETGQKPALSYRCADIDRIVPSLMGVSKVSGNKIAQQSSAKHMHASQSSG